MNWWQTNFDIWRKVRQKSSEKKDLKMSEILEELICVVNAMTAV